MVPYVLQERRALYYFTDTVTAREVFSDWPGVEPHGQAAHNLRVKRGVLREYCTAAARLRVSAQFFLLAAVTVTQLPLGSPQSSEDQQLESATEALAHFRTTQYDYNVHTVT